MAAETNVIKKANIAKVRELDYASLFGENIKNLIKMLGVTRMIPVTAETVLKQKKVTVVNQNGVCLISINFMNRILHYNHSSIIFY